MAEFSIESAPGRHYYPVINETLVVYGGHRIPGGRWSDGFAPRVTRWEKPSESDIAALAAHKAAQRAVVETLHAKTGDRYRVERRLKPRLNIQTPAR